jgi:solute carrier family 25 carnitine/acylcarnitine transporter 20/29
MDILVQTVRKEGLFALYKGDMRDRMCYINQSNVFLYQGMLSPLLGIAGVNSLLFAAYGTSKRLISPYPQLSLKEIAAAGAMAGAANTILASPGRLSCATLTFLMGGFSGDVQGQNARTIWCSYR